MAVVRKGMAVATPVSVSAEAKFSCTPYSGEKIEIKDTLDSRLNVAEEALETLKSSIDDLIISIGPVVDMNEVVELAEFNRLEAVGTPVMVARVGAISDTIHNQVDRIKRITKAARVIN